MAASIHAGELIRSHPLHNSVLTHTDSEGLFSHAKNLLELSLNLNGDKFAAAVTAHSKCAFTSRNSTAGFLALFGLHEQRPTTCILNKALLLGLDVCLIDKLLDCLRHEDDLVSAPHRISALRASLSRAELLLEPDETLIALKDQLEAYEKREKKFLSLFSPPVEGNKESKQREAARQVGGVLRELQALLPSSSLGPIYDVGQILSQTVEEMDKPFVRAAHVLSLWLQVRFYPIFQEKLKLKQRFPQCPTSWMQRFRDECVRGFSTYSITHPTCIKVSTNTQHRRCLTPRRRPIGTSLVGCTSPSPILHLSSSAKVA